MYRLLGTAAVVVLSIGFLLHPAMAQTRGDPQAPGNPPAWVGVTQLGMALRRDADGHTIVGSLRPDGPAAQSGLHSGDVLERIGTRPAPPPDQAAIDIRNAAQAGKSAVSLVVSRAGHDFYVVLPLAR
jgi:C-terminal processing protease CtpA/Prc